MKVIIDDYTHDVDEFDLAFRSQPGLPKRSFHFKTNHIGVLEGLNRDNKPFRLRFEAGEMKFDFPRCTIIDFQVEHFATPPVSVSGMVAE